MISGERWSPSWGHREFFSFHTCLPGVGTCSEHGWGPRDMDEWGIDDPGLAVPVGGQDGGGLEDLRSKMRSPDPAITHHQSSPLTAFCWKSSWTGGLVDSGRLPPRVHSRGVRGHPFQTRFWWEKTRCDHANQGLAKPQAKSPWFSAARAGPTWRPDATPSPSTASLGRNQKERPRRTTWGRIPPTLGWVLPGDWSKES